jgi:cyclic beta-1,2-glucan synthetase
LTRWRADTTRDDWGTWIYVQDLESQKLWSTTLQPAGIDDQEWEVTFAPHKVDFRCTDPELAIYEEITVAPEDDVEIRRVRVTNHGNRPRRLALTTYGEIVLGDQDADRRHPAFNKLFIESEYLPETNMLMFRRRPRAAGEQALYLAHSLVAESGQYVTGAHESDRSRFLGRGGTPRRPASLNSGAINLRGSTGTVLDPILALSQILELKPHSRAEVAFILLAADSREQVLSLAERYQDWVQIERAFSQALSQSELELRRLDLTSEELERFQQIFSLLTYPQMALRAERELLEVNVEGQSGLWPYAISGDYPILMACVENDSELGLVREMLKAHYYWRNRGLKIDLVILNGENGGYDQELQGQILRLVDRANHDGWLNRRGGIFVVQADRLDESGRVLLATAARVIFYGDRGTVAQQLESLFLEPARMPAFVPPRGARRQEATPPLARPANLRFDNGWGGFSEDGREYNIYLQPGDCTPAPWVNVVGVPNCGFLVSETGGGYCWALNSGENRLTPWSNDPVRDRSGEALYLRDEETAELWSPTPSPAGENAPYLIRHGAGYTIFEHHSHGLTQRLRLFASHQAPVKVLELRLENAWHRPRRLMATYYAEWVLGVSRDQTQQYVIPEYDATTGSLLACNPYNEEFGQRVAFVAASQEPRGLTADRTEFLGRLGNLRRPAALGRIGLASNVAAGLDPCAAVQLHIDLEPGEAKSIYFLVGQGADRAEALKIVRQYQNPDQVAATWREVTSFWDELLGAVAVQTPDEAMNLMLNRWLLYQNLSCRLWGRSGFYQSSGAYGFRDQLQDVLSVILTVPEVARAHILRAAGRQFEAGDVLHWWHPPSGRGVRTRIADDLLWLPYVTAHYVNSTGDESILGEKVPFLQGPSLGPDEEERYGHYDATNTAYAVDEHCRRAIDKTDTAGSHGLPLMGAGDWNDGMNRVGIGGRGESVWLGWFYYATLQAYASICERMGDEEAAGKYRQRMARLRDALDANAWDGAWYLRAFYDDGLLLGSQESQECQISSIAQSWAVISGAGRVDRVQVAMASLWDSLVRVDEGLVLLFAPPFDRTSQDPGYIRGYPPGIRENGGQYTHAATWAGWAFAESGCGDEAEMLFRMLNPIYHADSQRKSKQYKVEPYVVAADIYSSPPHHGRGGWTWYTGSAGWLYRFGLEAILGLRRQGDGISVDPCIPKAWPDFLMTYRRDQTTYRIRVENPEGVNRGVRQVLLDDEAVSNGIIKWQDDGREHQVLVLLGQSEETQRN